MPGQKSVAFLYANSEQSEKELKKVISFTVSTHKIRYSEINLTKEAKDLYNENYKTLKKEIEENTHTHTHTHKEKEKYSVFVDWKINIVKIFILPKAIYRFNGNDILHRNRKNNSKIYAEI